MENGSAPASPIKDSSWKDDKGYTKREDMALKVMITCINKYASEEILRLSDESDFQEIAEISVGFADHLLAQLEKKPCQ